MSDPTIPIYSRFNGGDRLSIYEDETIEIQHNGRAYRAPASVWIYVAERNTAIPCREVIA